MVVEKDIVMVAEAAEMFCRQSISVFDVQYLSMDKNFLGVDYTPTTPFCASDEISFLRSESVLTSSSIQATVVSSASSKFIPCIRSGSQTDKGCRETNEDEHICIDDLSAHLGYLFGCPLPSSFYGVFDGHGGSNAAAAFIKQNAVKLFFGDATLPQTSDIDENFLKILECSLQKAFLDADQAIAEACSVPPSCGTTVLTVLVLGRHLMVANAGDCRAVLCRKGVAIQMSQDHRPCYYLERKRIEGLGGYVEYGYLNGDLAVTRALGDWYMKYPVGSAKPLTAEPEVNRIVLNEDDEFLIVACDGIWDVISNEDAVRLVRRGLRRHNDPQHCAKELVNEALRLNTSDNLTAIVVCFAAPASRESGPQRPRLRCCSLSEDARNRLSNLLEGN